MLPNDKNDRHVSRDGDAFRLVEENMRRTSGLMELKARS